MSFYIQGITSEGDDFRVGPYFDREGDAMDYAVEYAHSVTGTDEVFADYGAGWVRAVGETYSETLRIEGS